MNDSPLNLDLSRTVLDEHSHKFAQFCEILIEENKKFNLTRIDRPEQIQVKHFLDSLAGLSVLDELCQETGSPLKILDIGSGAGFPGLVLAIVRSNWQITSLEATEKKVRFQKKVCETLGLKNVTVLHGRAEEAAHLAAYRQQYAAVTARALAGMQILTELSLGFLKTGGLGLYWKGPTVNKELKAATEGIRQMGAEVERTLAYILEVPEAEPANLSLVLCRKIKSTPQQYPRVFGVIKKKPL